MGAAYLNAPKVVVHSEHVPGCTGKVPFATRAHAKLAIESMAASHVKPTSKARPYPCPYCHQWHVGRGIVSPGRKPKSIEGINGI
jgi:hypothetical protein